MVKSFLIGAVLGFVGKKLYDNGSLDPAISKAKEKVDSLLSAEQDANDKIVAKVARATN